MVRPMGPIFKLQCEKWGEASWRVGTTGHIFGSCSPDSQPAGVQRNKLWSANELLVQSAKSNRSAPLAPSSSSLKTISFHRMHVRHQESGDSADASTLLPGWGVKEE